MRKIGIMVSLMALGVSSCGVFHNRQYEIVRVTKENDMDVKGVRFYQPRPYLCVTDNKVIINGSTRREPILGPDGKPKMNADGTPLWSETTQAMEADGVNRTFRIFWLPDPQSVFAVVGDIGGMQMKMASGWKLLEFDNKTFFAEEDATQALIQQINGSTVEPGIYELMYTDGMLKGMKRVQVTQ